MGLRRHHLLDEPSDRLDPGALLAAIEEARMVDVPSGEIPRVRAAPSR
jgi:hypothetical protein